MLTTCSSLQPDAPSLWETCLCAISEKVGRSNYETWFRTTECDISPEGTARILVPNRFFADFIEQHFSEVIAETLRDRGIAVTGITFVPTQKDWKIIESLSETLVRTEDTRASLASVQPGQFHPNYTFDAFVVGDSNRMAHAAALAVAEAPGQTSFNPFLLYGGTGLGKTHLLQAIGRYSQNEATADSVIYMTSEEFTNQYIQHVVEKRGSSSFYKKFARVDLLCIDDIHFFSGKPGTQKEFFRIFNRLLMEKKQIVLSSDRPPDQIPDMMEHIINRFMGGMVADIQPPNLETRMAILQKKTEIDGLTLPKEVVQYIAARITSNIRELEGMLIKLIASSSFTGRDITLEVAKELCGDMLLQKDERISVDFIKRKVAESFDVGPNQLSAHTRRRDVTHPRNIAMYLCKKWTRQSLRTIGLEFGGRDYSTVIHAYKKIEEQRRTDKALDERLNVLEAILAPLE